MSCCLLTETHPACLCSDNKSETPNQDGPLQKPSNGVGLKTLTLSFRALNLLDKSLEIVSKITSSFSNPSPEVTAGKEQLDSELPIISLDEVAWHDTIHDCWLVVCDYVYDCTDFIDNHPGGQDVLLEYAGRDATLAFIGSGHSRGANKLLERYLIGELPSQERIYRTPNGIKIGDFV